MMAMEAVKRARPGVAPRKVQLSAGMPKETQRALNDVYAKHANRDLARENERLKAAMRKLIAENDGLTHDLAVLARQVECVKTAASKLLAQFDARLQRLFDANNEAEAAIEGKVKRRAANQPC